MKFSPAISAISVLVGGGASGLAIGQTTTGPGNTESQFQSGEFHFFAAQRFWFASWDALLLDASIVIPNPANPVPVIQTGYLSSVKSVILPITSIGAAFGNWSLAANLTPTTNVSITEAIGGEVSRSEYDVSLGYAINENLSAALIYKAGKVENAVTISASNLLGVASSEQDLSGWLIGITGRGKVAENFTMYGNAAFGPGRATNRSNFGDTKTSFIYSIGEIGVSYKFPNISFGSWSIQAGYRIQSVLIKDAEFQTISLPPTSTVIFTERKNIQSTTQGIVLGISVAF